MTDPELYLMSRFVGLGVDEGKALYATLTPEQQKVLDDRGLKDSWRSMRAAEASKRREAGAWDKALEDAKRRKAAKEAEEEKAERG